MKKENSKPAPAKKVKEKLPPEKYWDTLVKKVYFVFYSRRMRDNDGFPLWPDWSPEKRGMEAASLKQIIIKLRTITEAKNIKWTEGVAVDEMHNFLQKAYNTWMGKHLLCSVMNKYKDMIIASESYSASLIERIIAEWYKVFPDKPRHDERDRTAAQITIGFLKQEYVRSKVNLTDTSVIQSVNFIFRHVKESEFWSQKTFRTIANQMQGFISEIKDKKNGTPSTHRKDDFGSLNDSGVQATDTARSFGKL